MYDTELQFWLASLALAAGRWINLRALHEALERANVRIDVTARA